MSGPRCCQNFSPLTNCSISVPERRSLSCQKVLVTTVTLICCMPCAWMNAWAGGDDLHTSFGTEDMISLAAGYKQPMIEAPSTTTIVTAEDIQHLSARSLADILEHVAGVHIARTPDDRGFDVVSRGRDRRFQFLVDNVPYVRGLIFAWTDLADVLPYDIARIEIVRGPGSAVYGADAVGGVINIITKSGTGLSGVEGGARIGEFNSRDGWFRLGTGWRDLTFNLYAAARTTDELDATIATDAQTTFDQLLGSHASLAPGNVNGHRDVTEARMNLGWGAWKLTMAHFGENDFHTGTGISLALDPNGIYNSNAESVDLSYRDALNEHWELSGYLSYVYVHQSGRFALFPPGAFDGAFPQGVLQELKDHEQRVHPEATVLYSGFAGHSLRAGLGAFRFTFVPDADIRNYVVRGGMVISTGVYAAGAGIGDSPVVARTVHQAQYVYVQDEWALAHDWRLTSGLRWDQYKTLGSTFNPRISLVWLTTSHTSLKLLYDTAFRPPGITETSSNGTFGGLGNPQLQPEHTHMIETVLSYDGSVSTMELTLFGYHDSGLIQLLPAASSLNGLEFFNQGKAEGYGVEWDAKYRPSKTLTIAATYAFQQSLGRENDNNSANRLVPKHHITTSLSWSFAPALALECNSVSVLDRTRPISDPRPPPKNYTLIGADVAWHSSNTLTAKMGARNIFNSDAREASSSPSTLYYDVPLPGREVFAELSVHL
jgi:outer membrane receptor protein involved in Fe transport